MYCKSMSTQLLYILCGLDMMHVHSTFGHACTYHVWSFWLLSEVGSVQSRLLVAACQVLQLCLQWTLDIGRLQQLRPFNAL